MAVIYRNQRKLGKIWPNEAGAIIASTIGGRRLGAFASAALAIMALLDSADKPLEFEPWCEWCDAIAASLTNPPDVVTEPEHLEPPVRKELELLLNPW